MSAGLLHLVFPAGEDYRRNLALKSTSTGAYVDITGYTLTMRCADRIDGSLRLTTDGATTTPAGGVITVAIVTGTDGVKRFQIDIAKEKLAALQGKVLRGVYTAKFNDGSRVIRTIEGSWELSPEA